MIPLLTGGKTFDLCELKNLSSRTVLTYFPYARLAYSDVTIQSYQVDGVEVFGLPSAPMSLTFRSGKLIGVHFVYEIPVKEQKGFRFRRHVKKTLKAVRTNLKCKVNRPDRKSIRREFVSDGLSLTYDIFQRLSLEETIMVHFETH